VWLASVSKRGKGNVLLPSKKWDRDFAKVYREVMCPALKGVGNPKQERLFRMSITLCLHRVTTADEADYLHRATEGELDGLAGGPVEILWSHGLATTESCQPCQNPIRQYVEPGRKDLWIPVDCGGCPSCLARQACCV
jgi:hypothetical protein